MSATIHYKILMKLHGLAILEEHEAGARGFTSITTDISNVSEKDILAGVCAGRNPDHAVLIRRPKQRFQLAIQNASMCH